MSKEPTYTKVQGLVHVETPKFEGKDGAVTPSSWEANGLSWSKDWQACASAWKMKDGKRLNVHGRWNTGKVTFTPNKIYRRIEPIVVQLNEKQQEKQLLGLKYTLIRYACRRQREKMWRLLVNKEKFKREHRSLPKEIPSTISVDAPTSQIRGEWTVVEENNNWRYERWRKVGTYAIGSTNREK